MPELPEVENTKRYLIDSGIIESKIQTAWTDTPNSWIGISQAHFDATFGNSSIIALRRIAKYLVIYTSDDNFTVHLGMTGWLRIEDPDRPAHKYTRHVIHFEDGRELRFVDSRKFGKIIYGKKLTESLLPDPLNENFSLSNLPGSILEKRRSVKSILMDQAIIPGLGNLYTDESLFQSKINPFTPLNTISAKHLLLLTEKIKIVLARSLDEYDLHRGADNAEPYFSLTPWDIKRKEGAPCFVCGSPMQFSRINARGTYFCLECQPM